MGRMVHKRTWDGQCINIRNEHRTEAKRISGQPIRHTKVSVSYSVIYNTYIINNNKKTSTGYHNRSKNANTCANHQHQNQHQRTHTNTHQRTRTNTTTTTKHTHTHTHTQTHINTHTHKHTHTRRAPGPCPYTAPTTTAASENCPDTNPSHAWVEGACIRVTYMCACEFLCVRVYAFICGVCAFVCVCSIHGI